MAANMEMDSGGMRTKFVGGEVMSAGDETMSAEIVPADWRPASKRDAGTSRVREEGERRRRRARAASCRRRFAGGETKCGDKVCR